MSDLINRQAAIDALNEYFARIGKLKRRGLTKGEKAISLDTVGVINTLPSAEPKKETVLCALADRTCPFQGKEYAWCLTCPHISEEDRALVKKAVAEPKTGEWVAMDEDLKISDYRCYKCGHYQDEISNFCPNCGARMLGGEEE